jgi:hypothetical protein
MSGENEVLYEVLKNINVNLIVISLRMEKIESDLKTVLLKKDEKNEK